MAPVNDNFANRVVLNGTSVTASGTNVGATEEVGEPYISSPNNTVWWSWTASTSGTVTINTNGSNFDTVVGIFTGSTVNNLTSVAWSDDAFGFFGPSEVTFNVVAGTTYQIAIDGYSSATGSIALNIDLASNTVTSNGTNWYGTAGNDYIQGSDGNDQIFGSEGVNQLFGGYGNDTIYGGSQRDIIRGGYGNDSIYASEGRNDVYGGDGNDIIYTGSGNDYIQGGYGNDDIWLGGGYDKVVLTQYGNGTDTINNFQDGQTTFALGDTSTTSSFTFSQLTIAQSGNNTLINFGSDTLATLIGVQASNITASDFVTIA